jgi:hypothetical protein
VTLGGYTFQGFYSPVTGKGGSCSQTLASTINAGSSVPIKFDVLNCNGVPATDIVPHVKFYKVNPTDCREAAESEGDATQINGQWHYNWSTKKPYSSYTWRIVVSLKQNGVPVPGTDLPTPFGTVYFKLK